MEVLTGYTNRTVRFRSTWNNSEEGGAVEIKECVLKEVAYLRTVFVMWIGFRRSVRMVFTALKIVSILRQLV